jgi:hypothetical protein
MTRRDSQRQDGLVFGLLDAWRGAEAGLQQALATDLRASIGGTSRARRALAPIRRALCIESADALREE